jgi:SAM-dependent methyltransferase
MNQSESHAEEWLASLEDAREYTLKMRKHGPMIYSPVRKHILALDISGRYLEVGAGPCILAAMIAENSRNVHITALDISPHMVAVAREYLQENQLHEKIRLIVGDASDKATLAGLGEFDLVYSTFSLHHWENPEKTIPNLWNVVAEKGLLYIHDFRPVWWGRLLPLDEGARRSMRLSRTPAQIKSLFQRLSLPNPEIKRLFPYFVQAVMARKVR